MVLSYTFSLCYFSLSWPCSFCPFLVLSVLSFAYVFSSFVSVHRVFPFPLSASVRVHVLCYCVLYRFPSQLPFCISAVRVLSCPLFLLSLPVVSVYLISSVLAVFCGFFVVLFFCLLLFLSVVCEFRFVAYGGLVFFCAGGNLNGTMSVAISF